MSSRLLQGLVCACVAALIPGSLYAVDGVVLISQPSSPQGFPITISQPGSYRLESNLVVPDANTTAIQITAGNVNLDLNGFGIFGPTVCTGAPVTSCAPAGSGSGVIATNLNNTPAPEQVTVSNGTVHGMGNFGVFLLGDSRVENIIADSNGTVGISIVGTVFQCVATRNGSVGISGRVVNDSVAVQNASTGIDIFGSGTGNSAIVNGGDGIFLFRGTLTANAAFLNQRNGITATCPGTVLFSAATHNKGTDIELDSTGALTCNFFNNATSQNIVTKNN